MDTHRSWRRIALFPLVAALALVPGVASASVSRAPVARAGAEKAVAAKRNCVRRARRARSARHRRAALHRCAHMSRRDRDRTPPETTITDGPNGTVTDTSASLRFASSETGSTFQCSLDGASWSSCWSPQAYSGLSAASHTFQVRARDAAGNYDGSPATRSWTVTAPGPTGSGTTSGTTSPTKASTVAAGTPVLGDPDAASHVRRSSWEPRPDNYTPNHRVPTASELSSFYSQATGNPLNRYVTGNFTGTTDELIQWVAWKWGIDEDLVRAEAAQESWWNQSALGDGGVSYGLMQIKSTVSKGTYPLSQASTAFNLDYYGATIRYYYDGYATWLGGSYARGDLWGAVGAYYSGRWHDADSEWYITQVKSKLSERTWEKPGF